VKRSALLVLVFATLASTAATARADIDGDVFTRDEWELSVSLTGPSNWVLSEERSYPSVWLWMVRRDPPGRMLLSAEQLARPMGARDYATRSAKLLESLGFAVRKPQLHSQTGAYWVDFDNGQVYLRQAFMVVGDIGFALSLAARDSRTRGSHLRAFDAALRSIKIHKARPQHDQPPGAPRPGAGAKDDEAIETQDAGAP